MDPLTFIAEIAKALAWPAIILIVLLVLHRPLITLIPGIKFLRTKWFEVEFGKKLVEAETHAEKIPVPSSVPEAWNFFGPSHSIKDMNLTRLVIISPRAAILETWTSLEVAMRDYLRHKGKDSPKSFHEIVRVLQGEADLPKDLVDLLNQLRDLRNQVAHTSDVEVSASQALEYARLVNVVINYLRSDSETPKR